MFRVAKDFEKTAKSTAKHLRVKKGFIFSTGTFGEDSWSAEERKRGAWKGLQPRNLQS